MNEIITCSVKEATKLMKHLNDDDMVTFTIINRKEKITHSKPQIIKKKNGVKMLAKAEIIEYQDNDFFGRFSLFGNTNDNNIIHNILFPQLE